MKIAISADHRGIDALDHIVLLLQHHGCQVVDMAQRSCKMSDYPDQAYTVARSVADGKADLGVLICGSGIGMCIAANKVTGVRAALVHDEIYAEVARRHNDANVLCLPADLLGIRIMERIVSTWLRAEFEGGRHARRVKKIAAIEAGQDPTIIEAEQAAAK